jgi:hypothetical protein
MGGGPVGIGVGSTGPRESSALAIDATSDMAKTRTKERHNFLNDMDPLSSLFCECET